MKTSELTSKDLMIEDWLQDSFGNIGQVYRLDPGRIHLRLLQERPQDEEYIVHDIEPIPLTPEILEKNGFEKHISSDTRMFFEHDEYRLSYYTVNKHFTIFNQIDGSLVQRVIVNVHELQHALRLCKIDKEIEL